MIKAVIKLKYFFKKYLKNQVLAVIFLFLSYFVTFTKPYLIGNLADSIASGNIDADYFYKSLLFFLFLIIFNYFINIGWSFNIFKNVYLVSRDARNMLMKKFLSQFPEFFRKNSTGSLMGKSTNDIESMSTIVGYGFITVFDGIIFPIFLIIFMFSISWKLTLFSLAAFPPFVIVCYKLNEKLEKRFKVLQESFDAMNEVTLESVSSVKVIRAFNVENIFQNKFKEKIQKNADADMHKVRLNYAYLPIANLFSTILTSITVLGGIFLIKNGEMTIGRLLTFTMYMTYLGWPAFALSDLFTISKEGNTSIDRIFEVLDYEEDIKDKENAIVLAEPETFEFKNYSFAYPVSDRKILEGIDFKFQKGDTIVLVGKTGSGKTTFIKQFLRLYNDFSGEFLINGIPIENYERKSLIDNISYVPQENYLFSKSIRDNIKFFRDFSDEEIIEASKLSDFEKDLNTFKDGLETMTGEKGVALSGGQRQRIALSRALIKDSEILILDDVFSAVDTVTEQNIIANLESLRNGKTNIIATHRLSVIKPTDTVIVLEDGKISAIGTHEEVMEKSDWYKEQYGIQLLEENNEN